MKTTQSTHTIDASGKTIGRVASAAAMLLMGKNDPSFERNKITGSKVNIENASKLKIDIRKLDTVEYAQYSGYPGGLRFESLAKVIEKKGFQEVLRRAVYGMLPANRLRPVIMKNLTITK